MAIKSRQVEKEAAQAVVKEKKQPAVLIRVPAAIADDVKKYIVHYRSLDMLQQHVAKELELYRRKNNILHIASELVITCNADAEKGTTVTTA
ncbi:MAG: hypothetical protein DRN30_06235 [Thermoplasmata archaeon]|nr:MAG: hypothetical protein DRN30_06235 [Thermoplasmata archaeon]